MGRKLRLSTHRKNEERKKHALKECSTSSKPGPDVMLQQASIPQPPLELIVSLPLQVFTSSTSPDLTTLHSRLVATKTLPSAWTDLSQLQSFAAVVLCTMRYNESTLVEKSASPFELKG